MASLYDFSPSPSRAGAPPVLLARGECVYTSQYCEENVWHLLQRLAAADGLPRVGSADDSLSAMASPRLSPPVPDIASDADANADADTAADLRGAVPDITVREHARSLSLSPVAPWPVHVGAGGRSASLNVGVSSGGSGALELYGVFITNANRQVRRRTRARKNAGQRARAPENAGQRARLNAGREGGRRSGMECSMRGRNEPWTGGWPSQRGVRGRCQAKPMRGLCTAHRP